MRAIALALVAGAASAPCSSAAAEEPLGPVFVFNRICYAQVPDTQGIENMALQLGWNPLAPSQMRAFGEAAGHEYFKGWDVQFGEEFYRVGVTRRAVSPGIAEEFPDFAGGTATACSLVTGNESDPQSVAQEMRQLAAKEPVSVNVDEGDVLTTTWAGGNDQFKVFLFNKISKAGDGGILNVTLISKE